MLLLKTEDVLEEELSSQNNPELSGLDYASHVPADFQWKSMIQLIDQVINHRA